MTRPLHMLASIPRSGSTLVASLLGQRPDTFVSITSGLGETISAAANTFYREGEDANRVSSILASTIEAHYRECAEDYVFDKGRHWPSPNLLTLMDSIQGGAKIIATVRPMTECVASYVNLVKPDDIRVFCNGPLISQLLWIANVLRDGYAQHPDSFLLIEYCDLVADPIKQLHRISDFIGSPYFEGHDVENIESPKEGINEWGIDNLHTLRTSVGLSDNPSAIDTLGQDLYNYYSGGSFWLKGEEVAAPVQDDLDIQVQTAIHGEIELARQQNEALLVGRPECDKVRFNSGWFSIRDDDFRTGHQQLMAGRNVGVFGNTDKYSNKPLWDGQTNSIVLLALEGGFGDQIHGLRYADAIAAMGNSVILSCSSELAPIFSGKYTVVDHKSALGAHHDYWVPSMSAVLPLGYTSHSGLPGNPYIDRVSKPVKGRIGVRWSGNPHYSHADHRLLSEQLMFDSVQGYNCVSLQRDEGSELRPSWMPSAKLDTWADTQRSISECELVISSCTSVAHLSAAMGVPTWIIVPVLPYYLWALPGDTTAHYDSVRLFRQEVYDDWTHPFTKIKEKLKCMHTLKMVS